MNDERMPINIYTLDFGGGDKEMTGKELIKDLKRNMKKWYFILAADIVFTMIIAYMNVKVPDMTMICIIIYIVALVLLILSIVMLHRYHSQYKMYA